MKYDLEHMNFVPGNQDIQGAFIWDRTPEGYKYWEKQAKNGLSADALKRWEQMEDQAKEEGFK